MKVVHVYWGLTYGGIETMLVNIANAQAAAGAKVYVVVINDYIEESLLNQLASSIIVYKLNRKLASKNLFFVLKFNRILKLIMPDAIHLHDSRLYKLIFSRQFRRLSSVTLHALPSGNIKPTGFGKYFPLLSFASNGNVLFLDAIPQIFSISEAVQQELCKKYGLKSTVIYNGINTSSFKKKENLKMDKSCFKVIQVSRLEHEIKGQDLLIKAASLHKDWLDVTFIGNGKSMEYLKNFARQLSVEKNVHFLGKRPQAYIGDHLCDYDLFVQASRWEGFGLTVAEAMSANIPVLVSSGQGPAEVTCGTKFGWIFENGSADDLAIQIDYIRNHYNEALNKAKTALSYIRNTYDVSVTAKKYLESY